jgi:hypothetical protein
MSRRAHSATGSQSAARCFMNIADNFKLVAFPDAAGTGVDSEQQPSLSLASRPMWNREGSFSPDMRARQGSFYL